MAFPDIAAKALSKYLNIFEDNGIDHVVAAGRGGESMQHVRVAQSGASPFAVTFTGLGLVPMANTTYDVIVQGPNGDERCDYATRTVNGFSITGGANNEQLIIMVMGRLRGQSAP